MINIIRRYWKYQTLMIYTSISELSNFQLMVIIKIPPLVKQGEVCRKLETIIFSNYYSSDCMPATETSSSSNPIEALPPS